MADSPDITNVFALPTAASRKVEQPVRSALGPLARKTDNLHKHPSIDALMRARMYRAALLHASKTPALLVAAAVFAACPDHAQEHALSVLNCLVKQTASSDLEQTAVLLDFIRTIAPPKPDGSAA